MEKNSVQPFAKLSFIGSSISEICQTWGIFKNLILVFWKIFLLNILDCLIQFSIDIIDRDALLLESK